MEQPEVRLRIQIASFAPGEEITWLQQVSSEVGGVASFVGSMRASNLGQCVQAMLLEHYPGMTERAISDIIDTAAGRWPLTAVSVIHRIGMLYPGESIVFVGVAGRHRGEAFAACEFIMDYLKTRAPFWKKEQTSEGERWVEARQSDADAAARWHQPD